MDDFVDLGDVVLDGGNAGDYEENLLGQAAER